ncbi:MAG: toll/interleukin-1 receptor domain-containing protein [Oscillospiraceae bacterium]|nr:toll/interleukin-1 receptor domain-containing protein [Oscillospiraceae bacterium]
MDVFISYSTKDQKIAENLIRQLEANNISYWICRSKISAGDRWASEIVEALDNCKVFLLIVSRNSLASEQVPKEINLALDRHIPIIPYKTDNSPITGEFAYHLANIHRIQAEPFDSRYNELIDAITSKLGRIPSGASSLSKGGTGGRLTANITNNISVNKTVNFSFVWVLLIIAAVIITAVIVSGRSEKNDTPVLPEGGQAIVQETEMISDDNVGEAADEKAAGNDHSASVPEDIAPYQTIDNQNFYRIYSNEPGESFKISGKDYSSGLTAVGKGNAFFLFNVSDMGYTNLSFTSGHVDGTDNDVQYILIYADNEEIYRKTVNFDEIAEVSDVDITGASQIKIEVVSPDAGFTSNAQTGIADIEFYNSANAVKETKAEINAKAYEKAPKDIMPYQTGSNINGYRIYNDSLKEDDYFTMAGEEYRSGFTADGLLDGMFLFNVADKGYTNMSFRCGHIDGTDMLTQYIVIYGDGEEIFRKEIDPEALPEAVDVPIENIGNIKFDFEYESNSVISHTSTGITELVFYNSSEYIP